MASIHKKPDSKYWMACFYRPDGRRAMRSTKQTNRQQAQKLADTYEAAYRQKWKARHVKRVMRDLYKDITGERMTWKTVAEYFEEWLDTREPELAENTINFYRAKTKQFLDQLGSKAQAEITDVESTDIVAFRNAELQRVGTKTTNHGLKFLKMVFKHARRDGLIVDNPAEFIDPVKVKDSIARRPFTLPELKTVLKHCDPEWQSMVYFGLYTGQRLGDVATLTWENVDLQAGEIRFETQKTGRRQKIPICEPLRRHILTLPAGENPEAPLHPRAAETVQGQGKTSTLSRQFAEILMQSGLLARKSHKKKEGAQGRSGRHEINRISFHALRHTATSLMKNAGVSASAVMELIGHDSEEVSRIYTHMEDATLRKAVNALPDIT